MKSTTMHMRLLLTLAFTLTLGAAHATSQDSTRNLLLDGIVLTGAAPATNTPTWETDEELSGFQGSVNWYITWDSTNLYLGRIGGNNNEGSILYLHADFPGATFADTAFSYDQLNPVVTPMGGVNFAAYLKGSYHEFRTHATAWSAPASTLGPQFTTQTNGDNMEVAIPWNAITAGNGRPTSIRLSLYQVAQPGGCTTHLIYGESPWGTGNPGDGPSAAVNDGTPTSSRQPGGCDVGDSTATRWWGCYPVMGSVGTNNWRFADSTLTQDTIACADTSAHALVAVSTLGAGTWTLLGAPGGAPPVTIANPAAASTTVSGLTASGTYTFLFTGTSTACYTSFDTVRFRVTTAIDIHMGPDTIMCQGLSHLLLPTPQQAIAAITWSTGSTDDSIYVNQGGTYFFTATDTLGCLSVDTIVVTEDLAPHILTLVVDTSACPLISFSMTADGNPTSYTWDLGSGVVLTGPNASYNYQAWGNGTYTVYARVVDDCWMDLDAFTLTINCIVGVQEQHHNALAVSPNPGSGTFKIEAGADILDLQVHDLTGRLAFKKHDPSGLGMVANLELTTLAEGQYILRVQTTQGMAARRINIVR